jgi:hypothetical protein
MVGALGDDLAVIEQHHAVGQRDRRRPVGDDQRRAVLHHLAQRGADLVLLGGVDRRRGVVQDQHPGLCEHRAGDGDALPLPAGEREALLADHGVVALGKRVDEAIGTGESGRVAHGVHVGFGIRERDVLAHRVGEQERVLEHDADRLAQVGEAHVAHVDAVERDPPGIDVVEAGHEAGDGRLPAARRAHQRDGLAAAQDEIQPVEHRRAHVAVAEGDVLEAQLARARRQLR